MEVGSIRCAAAAPMPNARRVPCRAVPKHAAESTPASPCKAAARLKPIRSSVSDPPAPPRLLVLQQMKLAHVTLISRPASSKGRAVTLRRSEADPGFTLADQRDAFAPGVVVSAVEPALGAALAGLAVGDGTPMRGSPPTLDPPSRCNTLQHVLTRSTARAGLWCWSSGPLDQWSARRRQPPCAGAPRCGGRRD